MNRQGSLGTYLMRFTLLLLVSLFFYDVSAQKNAFIYGKVTDNDGIPIPRVFIILASDSSVYTYTNNGGNYSLNIPPNTYFSLVFSYLEKNETEKYYPLMENQKMEINKKINAFVLKTYNFTQSKFDKFDRLPSTTIIRGKNFNRLPSANGNFESILRSLNVSSNSELSSGYNVRGGNFDENLVYVNDIEIYRPQLVRSGQQEGLSFINPDMVDYVKFSTGGFESRYGDKLSSVLDVSYKEPTKNEALVNVGLLGARLYYGGNVSSRFKYMIGARYKSNAYLLNTFDVQGEYKPVFADIQTNLMYKFNTKTKLSYLGNLSVNRYTVVPQSQQTSFGTVTEALLLTIFFEGQERMLYENTTNALYLDTRVSESTNLKFYGSHYYSSEREYYTVEGAYRLDELDNQLGSDKFAQAKFNRGAGYFLNSARNELSVSVFNGGLKGKTIFDTAIISYGVNISSETVKDKIREWSYQDSADYSVPFNTGDTLNVNYFLNSKNAIISNRLSAYFQYERVIYKPYDLKINVGLRTNYWTYNNQTVVSPRIQLTSEPNKIYNRLTDSVKKKDYTLKAAFGYYYQPPFYRELRNLNGVLNSSLRAQRSIHYILGTDYYFTAWGRPFKFYSELYYKKLDDMVPYLVENVRIRYYAENASKGYATGLDTRVNGEFIEGLESWFSLSYLNTKEKITHSTPTGIQETGYLRRPTDQRINFSVFFQDELEKNPKFKINLLVTYGSNVPYYLQGDARYKKGFKIPSYKRVDIGFTKEVLNEKDSRNKKWKTVFKSLDIGLQVLNLTQANNTISYIWVTDFQGETYGVPAYLTSRRINLTFQATF